MTQITTSGTELHLRPEEESVPYDNWLTQLKNLALECVRAAHLPLKKGKKHDAGARWMVLIAHALMDLSLSEASNRLDELLWAQANLHRRHKLNPTQYAGTRVRRERKCPNGDQVRKYRNTLPALVLKKLNRFIFERQLDYALDHKLISMQVDLLVDNTDQWYYGGDRYPANSFITKGQNGPGTSRKRKYLAIMLKCGTTYLFVGHSLIKKGASNVPDILSTADWLIKRGFKIRYLLADRWFPTFELLAGLQPRGIKYIGRTRNMRPCGGRWKIT